MGKIFNVQRFSIQDGPGIRTTVFFKGCPLNCVWCHNPESKAIKTQMMFDEERCTLCRSCERVCPFFCHDFSKNRHEYNREKCILCGKCIEACPNGLLETVGYEASVEEIIKEVLKDEVFYKTSGGGITLSGGEPMLQFDFAYELLSLAKEKGLHTCIETCGFASKESYEKIAPLVDVFLFDYKESDAQKHLEYTGVSNEKILENLKTLCDGGNDVILRCPIIPTFNDREDHLLKIAEIAQSVGVTEINVEPYHPLGTSKETRLGNKKVFAKIAVPDKETVDYYVKTIASKTSVLVKAI